MLKYRINHYLSLLPKSIPISKAEQLLEEKYKISPEQFQSDRSITIDSCEEIPINRLMVYAHIFNVSIDSLLVKTEAI